MAIQQQRRFLMNVRNAVIVFGVVSVALSVAGTAPAQSFVDLSAMTSPNYYSATPMGVTNSGAVVTENNRPPADVQYNYPYLYTGGTAGTYTDITSKVTSAGWTRLAP